MYLIDIYELHVPGPVRYNIIYRNNHICCRAAQGAKESETHRYLYELYLPRPFGIISKTDTILFY